MLPPGQCSLALLLFSFPHGYLAVRLSCLRARMLEFPHWVVQRLLMFWTSRA